MCCFLSFSCALCHYFCRCCLCCCCRHRRHRYSAALCSRVAPSSYYTLACLLLLFPSRFVYCVLLWLFCVYFFLLLFLRYFFSFLGWTLCFVFLYFIICVCFFFCISVFLSFSFLFSFRVFGLFFLFFFSVCYYIFRLIHRLKSLFSSQTHGICGIYSMYDGIHAHPYVIKSATHTEKQPSLVCFKISSLAYAFHTLIIVVGFLLLAAVDAVALYFFLFISFLICFYFSFSIFLYSFVFIFCFFFYFNSFEP